MSPLSLISLPGKVCLVTGGAGGLGKAIAQALLKSGAKIIISDINKNLLAECTSEFPSDTCAVINADATKEESASTLFDEIISKFGHLDVLINNAGIMDHFDPAGDLDKALWDKVLAVNLTGPYIMTKLAVRHFLGRSSKGVILNIGSLSSFRGGTAGAAYTASKHGLLGLTKNTAASYGKDGIRCNIVMPGTMATNIGLSFATGINENGLTRVQKLMEATNAETCDLAQIGQTCAFLCSDAAEVLNGTTIVADKGWCSA